MRHHPFVPALAALCLVLPAPQALAQQNDAVVVPPAAPADENFADSHLRAAQRIVEVTRADAPFDDILPALASQTRLTFVQATPALAREIEDTVMEVAIEMASRRAELARTMQLVWARRFTEEELGELHVFFTGDTGAKFANQIPVISALTMGAARQWEANLATEMVNETRRRLRDKGLL